MGPAAMRSARVGPSTSSSTCQSACAEPGHRSSRGRALKVEFARTTAHDLDRRAPSAAMLSTGAKGAGGSVALQRRLSLKHEWPLIAHAQLVATPPHALLRKASAREKIPGGQRNSCRESPAHASADGQIQRRDGRGGPETANKVTAGRKRISEYSKEDGTNK